MTTLGAIRMTATAFFVLGLAGCSGGGGADLPDASLTGKIDMAKRDSLNDRYEALDFGYHTTKRIEGHAVRTSGIYTFNGVAALRPSGGFTGDGRSPVTSNPDLIADMALNVDFGNDSVSGAMWNFHNAEGARAGGSVQLVGVQDGGGITASGNGTLDWGDRHQVLDVDFGGAVLADEIGARGDMNVTSTIGTEITTMDGHATLESDRADYPIGW